MFVRNHLWKGRLEVSERDGLGEKVLPVCVTLALLVLWFSKNFFSKLHVAKGFVDNRKSSINDKPDVGCGGCSRTNRTRQEHKALSIIANGIALQYFHIALVTVTERQNYEPDRAAHGSRRYEQKWPKLMTLIKINCKNVFILRFMWTLRWSW